MWDYHVGYYGSTLLLNSLYKLHQDKREMKKSVVYIEAWWFRGIMILFIHYVQHQLTLYPIWLPVNAMLKVKGM